MLSVDVEKLRELDTRNAEHLFGLYSSMFSLAHLPKIPKPILILAVVFSKCAESMEDGRRLENLTWRLWNRETLCCEPQPEHNHTTTPSIAFTRSRPSRKDVPVLSASVESFVSNRSDSSDETQQAPTAPLNIHANTFPKADTLSRSGGKEKHITSLGLEKMVHSIQDKQDITPLSPSIANAIPPMPTVPSPTNIIPRVVSNINAPFHSSDSSASTAPLSSPESDESVQQTVGSDTSAEAPSSHSVIRGFSRDKASFYRSYTHLAPEAIPIKHGPTNKTENTSKKGPDFFLGAPSSGDDDSSFDDKMASPPKQSSLTIGLKRPSGSKKTLSFRDEVESRALEKRSHEDEEVFESDDEDESAIDDDSEEEEEDDDDWEDDASESAENPASDKPLFQRVDSQPNLVSRRSLLTTELHQIDRAATFANLATKTAPLIRRTKTSSSGGPSDGVSPVEDPSHALLPGHMTRSKPIIVSARSAQQMAFSPKTTRRNMLATEMTESLRKNVLWERQQKKATTNAIIKRRHTAQNLTNLQNYPGEALQASRHGSRNTSFDHYFEAGLGEYHRAGW